MFSVFVASEILHECPIPLPVEMLPHVSHAYDRSERSSDSPEPAKNAVLWTGGCHSSTALENVLLALKTMVMPSVRRCGVEESGTILLSWFDEGVKGDDGSG